MEIKGDELFKNIEIEQEKIELTSLHIDPNTKNKPKKKYIILGISLVIVFVLTLIIIRLVSDDREENKFFEIPTVEKLSQDSVLNTPSTNEQYEELIEEKSQETIQEPEVKRVTEKEIIVPIVQKKVKTKEVIKKEIIKKTKSSGFYVQIGAFSKSPNKTLLRKIGLKGFEYIIHNVTIKGKTYHKVLIGPYKNRSEINKVFGKIKKDLKKPNAYILRLK